MRRQSLLWRLAASAFLLLGPGTAVSAQTAEVYFGDQNTRLEATTPALPGRLPVLFVHGHNFDNSQDNDLNYQKNWQNSLGSLPSFKQALTQNPELGIEPYYIRFVAQDRSITDDAAEISDAIDLILHRHDATYAYPHNSAQTTHVKVVIIAYSKGTISARQYLKSLWSPVPGLRAPEMGFSPVSEFIAIAPPNHGLSAALFDGTQSLALQQLHNGFRPGNLVGLHCGEAFSTPQAGATNYIQDLNGHPTQDTTSLDAGDVFVDEAWGSRADIDATTNRANPPTAGTLYVTIFANGNRDSVGGDTASNDCQGRKLALNLSPQAVNIPVSSITGNLPLTVHQNTVHTTEVMCLALYAAVHHRSPVGQTCTLDSSGLPVIPPPPRAAAVMTLDFSGSMGTFVRPGVTRADVLKQAVELFVQLWSTVGVPSDRIGVNYFRTDVTQPLINNETLPLLSTGSTGVIDSVRMQTPGNSTAMGNGLQRAIETLRDSASDSQVRRVLLFTDGMQNVNPMARIVNGQLQFVNEAGRPNSNVSPTAPSALDPALGIAVDTIGIGAGDEFVGLLNDIATQTDGRTWLTSDPDENLRRFFVEQLINALRGFSPQLVAYRHGSINAFGVGSESFAIEDGVRRIVLKVSWKHGDSIDFSVIKDGFDVTSAGRFINGSFYKIFVIDPGRGRGPLNSGGNWRIRIKGKAAAAYETAAIVDGGSIRYDAFFRTRRPRIDEWLDFVVRVTLAGKPIDKTAKVTVTLTSPTAAARDLLNMTTPARLPALEPDMTARERQSLNLAQDPKRWAALKPKLQTLLLKRTLKGDFRARIRPQLPGIYTAYVTIQGDAAKLGRFSRTLTATTVVQKGSAPKPR